MRSSTGQASAGGLPAKAAEVRALLAKGNTKSAVEAAKLLHKNAGTPATEALLVEAYLARAASMTEHQMAAEADALIAMVRQRYPASAASLNARWSSLSATGSALEELLRPLADPTATAETRAAAEQSVRTRVVDLSALANCSTLAADHPLRLGAAAVHQVFEAVTAGPVDDDAPALPSISRRSPLAPWKPLIRAIASFYRQQDSACLEHLQAVDPDSAAARLVPALRAMASGEDRRGLKPAAAALAGRVCGNIEGLRSALAGLDRVLLDEGGKRALSAIRDTVAVAQKECPEVLPELRLAVSVRSSLANLQVGSVFSALGGAPAQDARYSLRMARAMETDEDLLVPACHLWEDFRRAAIEEKWFPARGPEAATVYLHMAELAAQIDPDDLEDEIEHLRGQIRRETPEGFATDEPGIPYLHPEWLFEQACAMDPNAETFQRWAGWGEENDQPQAAEKAALAWHRTLPADPRPLLRLMRYAEDRNALKKALGYLRQAEALDGVSSEVRRARLRLLILGAVRHLNQRKPHLAEPELLELEALPQARENDRPAFVAALRAIAIMLTGEGDRFVAAGKEVQRIMGSEFAGSFALAGVGSLCGQPLGITSAPPPGNLLEPVARVWAMGQDLGFRFCPPAEWKTGLLKELRGNPTADTETLERVAEMALRQRWNDLAYAVSAAGLSHGKADARFLLLRARALPFEEFSRSEECVMAVIALARRRNDVDLANQAIEYWRNSSLAGSMGMELDDIGERELQKVLHRERTATGFRHEPDFRLPFGPRRRRGGRRRRGPAPENADLPF